MKTKKLAILTCVMLILVVGVGATLAWLTDKSETVTNTFTPSDVNVGLTETTEDYQMIPGFTIAKDPVVTVEAGSEDCWVFIKVTEDCGDIGTKEDGITPYGFDDFIEYDIDSNNWTALEGEDGVYYCYAKDITADRNIKVLEGNQVTVKGTVTKEMMDALETAGVEAYPNLTFTAYVTQYWQTNDTPFEAAAAWELAKENPVTP